MFCDDCGFNDFGFHHNSNIQTPFIDSLVLNEGLLISSHYVHTLCSPTRAAFLSGRYAHKLGLQIGMISENNGYSLTRQVSLLSNEFQSQGYATHAIGKWHLGYQAWEYTPTYRGFDTFAGFYNADSEYYTHRFKSTLGSNGLEYYDLRLNEEPVFATDIYGTLWEKSQAIAILKTKHKLDEQPFFMYLAWQAAHEPSDAPLKYQSLYCENMIEKCSDPEIHKAQLTSLDDNIKDIVLYLKDNDLWHRTLIVFSGDNGAAVGYGDNYPLRSSKYSPFEGGVRVPAFVTGGFLSATRYGEQLDEFPVHVSDWYPTLLSAAGLSITHAKSDAYYGENDGSTLKMIDFDVPLDGFDIWQFIQFGTYSKDGPVSHFISPKIKNNGDGRAIVVHARDIEDHGREIILNINNLGCNWKSCGSLIIGGRWKYVRGGGMCGGLVDCDRWEESVTDGNMLDCPSYSSVKDDITSVGCIESESGCLFDIMNDPCEYYNVGQRYVDILKAAQIRLQTIYDEESVIALDMARKLSADEIDPKLNSDDSEFWGPYQMFSEVDFEMKMYHSYSLLYEQKAEVIKVQMDEAQIVEDGVVGSDGEYQNSESNENKSKIFGIDNNVFAVILIVGVIILLFMLYFVISRVCGKIELKSQSGSEMQPLIL